MSGWRYIATRINGDGTETRIADGFPMSGVQVFDELSGPGGLSGEIAPETLQVKDNETGEHIFKPWTTGIYAENSGLIRGGGILMGAPQQGQTLNLDAAGHTVAAVGTPYREEKSFLKQDPLDLFRHIWLHIQSQNRRNLGLTFDMTVSPIRLGTPAVEGDDTTGPYTLNYWETQDLGKELDELAANTPFEYRLVHSWNGEEITHHVNLGYPRLGARRTDLRFVLGENIFTDPSMDLDGDDYATEIIVLGAGTGRTRIRGMASRPTDVLGRTRTVEDASITTQGAANKKAGQILSWATALPEATQLFIPNHPNATLGSYSPGDEILFETKDSWNGPLSIWLKILSVTIDTNTDQAAISVVRAEKV